MSLPCGQREPMHLRHPPQPSKVHYQKAGSKKASFIQNSYLCDGRDTEREGERERKGGWKRSPIHWLTPQRLQQRLDPDQGPIWVFHVSEGPSSSTFPVILAGSWIESGIASNGTGIHKESEHCGQSHNGNQQWHPNTNFMRYGF